MAHPRSSHRSTVFNAQAAGIAVTSVWVAIIGLVGWHRRIRAQERDEALAEERRKHLFGTAHPHTASAN